MSIKGLFLKYLIFSVCLISLFYRQASAVSEISETAASLMENNIIVSARLTLDEQSLSELKNGISKEIIFYVDLFRVWQKWPDEFVLGKVFTKTLKCDPIKKEYAATSFDEMTLIEKRFRGCEPLITWALKIPELRLTNISELAPGEYFIRVTVESRLRRLPPVIGYLLFFVKEKEFVLSRDSAVFQVKR